MDETRKKILSEVTQTQKEDHDNYPRCKTKNKKPIVHDPREAK